MYDDRYTVASMLIFADHITPRLEFVLKFIFRDVLGSEYRITTEGDEFTGVQGPKIKYSRRDLEGGLCLPVSGLMERKGVVELDPGLKQNGDLPLLFHHSRQNTGMKEDRPTALDFDVFAAVFYMLSRYEEYLPFEPDFHGRFEAGQSLAARKGFLEKPVVDLWIGMLATRINEIYPGCLRISREFRFLPTSDIDLPYAFLHRGRLRTMAAGLRAGLKGQDDRGLRRAVLSGQVPDPYDTFKEMEAIHALHGIRPVVFFLASRYGRFDKSISPLSQAFTDLVRQTMKFADLGIHPSYRAAGHPPEIRRELRILSAISGVRIERSRQHFLKLRLPNSYREYLSAGIREEYSMGYASGAGFRAGTSRPFYFFDLEAEEETGLRVVPFQVMDRTLKDYMGLTPDRALEKIMEIAGFVRSTGGTFASIWHNDAFSNHGEWKGWKDVYLKMIDELSSWSDT
jgi:hypothetical protein